MRALGDHIILEVIMAIDSFDGEYSFLSNFATSVVYMGGKAYPTVEHAFQAAKSTDPKEQAWVREAPSAGEAKRRGRRGVTLRKDWERDKVRVMSVLVYDKFTNNDDLKKRLLDTGDEDLIEGNTWNDTFWGVCHGSGHNYLGKILMAVRSALRGETTQLMKYLSGQR